MTIKQGFLNLLIENQKTKIQKAKDLVAPTALIETLEKNLAKYQEGKVNFSKRISDDILNEELYFIHSGTTLKGRSFILINLKYEFVYNKRFHSWFINDGSKLVKYKLKRLV